VFFSDPSIPTKYQPYIPTASATLSLSKSIGAKDVGPNAFPVSESMIGYDPLFVRETGIDDIVVRVERRGKKIMFKTGFIVQNIVI
jgi:hypothetical protein